MTQRLPTPAELDWARLAARTPHYVLSNTVTQAAWPKTLFVRKLDEIALFGTTELRRKLELQNVQQLEGGRVNLT
jgi:hypothetical protein